MQWLFYVKYYIKTCQWFLCVTFIEYYLNFIIDDMKYYYLGYCYQKLSYTNVAIFYYVKIAKTSSYYINALANLISIYDSKRLSTEVIEVCNKLISIDPSNNIAIKYLNKYS
uniref:Tetratricopeptide repeat protein n=1 Tax=Crouania attenuata TaxID=42002 RepID=A0A4D6WSH4_9FLOR|nr:hypothetical protein [Crouania attenuata]